MSKLISEEPSARKRNGAMRSSRRRPFPCNACRRGVRRRTNMATREQLEEDARDGMREADERISAGQCKHARFSLERINAAMKDLRLLGVEPPELVAEWRAVLTRYAIANGDGA